MRLREVTIPNRVWLSPMCMYSSEPVGSRHGIASDWHACHLESRAVGGAGLAMVEATAVTETGRLTDRDLGVWADWQVAGLTRLATLMARHGTVPGLQLGHAGAKGSVLPPWLGRHQRVGPEDGGWLPWSPSPREGGEPVHVMSHDDADALPGLFARAAARADKAGFQVVEIHAAHGYLLHEFLSPLTNHRADEFGTDRNLLLSQVVSAVRHVWPEGRPLFVRLSAVDWVEGGLTLEDTIETVRILKDLGVDLIDVSSGGLVPASIDTYPGYQVPFATAVREASGLPVAAVGLIETPEHVAELLTEERTDAVFAGRAFLRDPYWARHVLQANGALAPWPAQYEWAIG